MEKVEELAKQYKKTKKQELLNQIFIRLQNIIKKKADFIFYQKKFNCNGKIFRLNDIKKCELNDVLQELNLEVLRIIDNYDTKKPFKNYFFATLWDWRPSFIRTGTFFQEMNILNESNFTKEDNENIFDSFASQAPETLLSNIEDSFKDLTKEEKKVLLLLDKNSHLNQSQIAQKLKVTQQRVSQIMQSLQKKYNPYL